MAAKITNSHIPLWALICIVIGGIVIAVTGTVLALLFKQHWRRQQRRKAGYRKRTIAIDDSGREVSVYRGADDGGEGELSCDEYDAHVVGYEFSEEGEDGEGEGTEEEGDTERHWHRLSGRDAWGRRTRQNKRRRKLNKLRKRNHAYYNANRRQGERREIRMVPGNYYHQSAGGMVSSVGRATVTRFSPDMDPDRGRPLSLPPVLPLLFGGRRLSPGLFSMGSDRSPSLRSRDTILVGVAAGGGSAGSGLQRPAHQRRMSNAWVDEDAIHGPVTSASSSPKKRAAGVRAGGGLLGKEGGGGGGVRDRMSRVWRQSFRESWPLKSISPTLPMLAYFGSPKIEEDGIEPSGGAQRPGVDDEEAVAAATMYNSRHHNYQQHHPYLFHPQPVSTNLNIPKLPIPHDNAADQNLEMQYSPPRKLPQPPRQAHVAAAASNTDAPVGSTYEQRTTNLIGPRALNFIPREAGLSYYMYEDINDRPGTSGGGSRRSRASSTDSTLTEILRGTERRLQRGLVKQSSEDGLSSGNLAKHSLSSRPIMMARTRSGSSLRMVSVDASNNGVGSSATTLVGVAGPWTPSSLSQVKAQQQYQQQYHHRRANSQGSVASDADSLGGNATDASPGPGGGGGGGGFGTYPSLSSTPKRPANNMQPYALTRKSSMTDSITSSIASAQERSLSTIDSVDERADETRATNPGESSSSISDEIRKITELATSLGEPRRGVGGDNDGDSDAFVAMRASPNASTSGERVSGPLRPVTRGKSAFHNVPRIPVGPFSNRSEVTAHSLQTESPLSIISSTSRTSHEHRSLAAASLAAPTTSAALSTTNLLHRRNLSTVHDLGEEEEEDQDASFFPGRSLASFNGGKAAPLTPHRKSPGKLQAQASSPTLGYCRDRTPDFSPPSPAILRMTNTAVDGSSASSQAHQSVATDKNPPDTPSGAHHRRRAAGEVHKMSDPPAPAPSLPAPAPFASSSSTHADWEKGKLDALTELSMLVNGELMTPTRGAAAAAAAATAAALPPAPAPASPFATTATAITNTVRLVPPEDYRIQPVSSTVAQLRRMNSQMSSYSAAASGYSDGTGSSVSVNSHPMFPTLREQATWRFAGGSSMVPGGQEASSDYLALGNNNPSRREGGGIRRNTSQNNGTTGNGNNGNDDNNRGDMNKDKEEKTGEKADLEEETKIGPEHKNEADEKAVIERSEEEKRRPRQTGNGNPRLSIYDSDGFWISPERRMKVKNGAPESKPV